MAGFRGIQEVVGLRGAVGRGSQWGQPQRLGEHWPALSKRVFAGLWAAE